MDARPNYEARGLANISAGLARRARLSTLPIILPGSPRDLPGLLKLGHGIEMKATRYKEWAGSIAIRLKEFREREVARLHKIDVLTPEQRHVMLNNSMRAKHAELLAWDSMKPGGVDDHDKRIRGEIRDAARKAESVAHLFADPVAVLVREILSDPKASTYHDALRHAGPAEIAVALEESAATSDPALWAACHRRLSAMPADDRRQVRVDEREVASRLAGPRCAAALAVCEKLSILSAQTELEAARVRGAEVPSDVKIQIGLRVEVLAAEIERLGDSTPEILKPAEPAKTT